jgi:ribonucleoside-diphosphate reductase alpha chain
MAKSKRRSYKAEFEKLEGELAAAQITIKEMQEKLDSQRAALAEEKSKSLEHSLNLALEIDQLKSRIGQPVRRRLSDTRRAVTHKFSISGHEGYMTVGMFDDGSPGELFITMAKEGSTVGGLMDTIGTLTSIALQYGVGIETLARKFVSSRFEPSGYTANEEIKIASSIIDYVFRWLDLRFVPARHVPPTVPSGTASMAIAVRT